MLCRWSSRGFWILLSSLFFFPSILSPTLAQPTALDAKSRAIQLYNDSVQLINQNKLETAESKLEEACRLDSDNALILNNYGLTLLKLGKLLEARKTLEKAITVNPRLDLALLNLGLACEGQGDLSAARKYLLSYIEISGNKEQVDKMKDHVAIIDKTLASGLATTATNTDDYFGQILRNQMYPWPKERLPIKLYLTPGDSVDGYKASYGADLQRAVETWSKALASIIEFKQQDKADGADIVVHWSHDFKTALMKAEGGDCKYVADGAGMKHADITLLTIDPSASDKLNDAKVSWVALHELGHALGINGHSNNPSDVMYFAAPLKNSMPELSARDVRTFKRLYSEKLPDTWLSLNDEAIKLMRSGNIDLAIEKLNAAIKLNPAQKVLKENLLLAEARKSSSLLDAEKYKEAEPHLQKALELEEEARDENFDTLISNYALLLKNAGRAGEIKEMYIRYNAKAPK